MSTNVTPDKARALLRGDFASDARQTSVGNLEANFDSFTGAHIAGTPGDFTLTEEAGALAELVANMHYEYAVATGPDHSPAYAAMNSQGRFIGTTLALADWWQTKGEAQDLVDELRGENEHSTARIVRRLATDPEVVE